MKRKGRLRNAARALGAGKALRHLWHTPKAKLRQCIKEGGPLEQRRMANGRAEMKASAETLPPIRFPREGEREPQEIHLLTGRDYWFQSAYFLASLAHQCSIPLRAIIHSDGNFDDKLIDKIHRFHPQARIVPEKETEEAIEVTLPRDRFPVVRSQRDKFVTFRKITDVHIRGGGWKLFLDSDMLSFREPKQMLHWLCKPENPLVMRERQDSYGWSSELLSPLANGPLPRGLNVGFLGLRSDQIDWEKMEFQLRRLIETGGPKYYIDQALAALMATERKFEFTDPRGYIVMPNRREAEQRAAAIYHYVDHSKRWYFTDHWRIVDRRTRENQ